MKDKIIEKLIKAETKRQRETINLIASENFVSDDVLSALGSPLTNKYSEGYPGKRYYPGNIYYDEIEELAKRRALKTFHLKSEDWSVNVQPYSGSPANLAIYSALMKPGEKLMGMALSSGGHLTHGHRVSFTGKFWTPVQYLTAEDGWFNYDEIKKLAMAEKPKVIVSGFTAYPRQIDFKRFGEIAKSVGAYHVADISHIAGLVAAGLHPSPFPYADVVMTTTHKTLRGPRGAAIFSKRVLARRSLAEALGGRVSPKASAAAQEGHALISDLVDKAVFPGLQGGPHNNVTAAKAVAFFEAMNPKFKQYQKQIVKNAKVLASELMRLGFHLITGGTENHLMLIDLRKSDFLNIDGITAEKKLEAIGIIANRNTVSGDTSPFKPSGLRLGTPAVTTRGMKEKEMREIARLIYESLTTKNITSLRKKVMVLAKRF